MVSWMRDLKTSSNPVLRFVIRIKIPSYHSNRLRKIETKALYTIFPVPRAARNTTASLSSKITLQCCARINISSSLRSTNWTFVSSSPLVRGKGAYLRTRKCFLIYKYFNNFNIKNKEYYHYFII